MEQLGISRELPPASAEEIAAASGPRTKSIPSSSPRRQPAREVLDPEKDAGPSADDGGDATASRPAETAHGLWVGVARVSSRWSAGSFSFVLQQSNENRRAAEQAAHLAAQRIGGPGEAGGAARRGRAERQESERVQLSVVSDPMGAVVEATWNGGVKAAVTPFDLAVPRNASVRFAFTKKEFGLPHDRNFRGHPQGVRASLLAEPKAPPVVQGEVGTTAKKAKQASSESDESSIPVEF